MAPLLRKESTKRTLPTSPTSQAPFPNDSKRQRAEDGGKNVVTGLLQTRTDQQRYHHMPADPHQVDLLNDCDFSFAAVAFEDHAAEHTRMILDAIASTPLRQQHQTYREQSGRHHAIGQSGVTACAAQMGYGIRRQKPASQTGGRRFVLNAEDSSSVCEFLRRVTPIGESPPDMQSITDLMESGNGEEDAKQFLEELEANMKQRCPPKSRSLIRVRENPFIRDISRLKGPIYNYSEDSYFLE